MVLLVAAMMIAAPVAVVALPHQDDPIDPSKRAPISTSSAVRPSASAPVGSGIVGDGRVPVTRADLPTSPFATPRAPVVVSESREKTVRKPGVRKNPRPRTYESRRASSLPASIPQLDHDRFRTILTQYRAGTKSAADLAHQRVRVGGQTVDLADINRFADPRATLEAQGIPVVTAGSGASEAPSSAPVPVSGKDAAASK